MSTLVAAPRVPATAALVELLDVIGELGTSTAIELNRAHFSIQSLEGDGVWFRSAPPSDRWYRLYEQMAYRALNHTDPHLGSHLNSLAAGFLYQQIDDLETRAAGLPRHPARASIRKQIEEATAFSRDIAGSFLESAIQLLAVGEGVAARDINRRPGAKTRRTGGLVRTLQARLTAAVNSYSDDAGSSTHRPTPPPALTFATEPEQQPAGNFDAEDARPAVDIGAELRAARNEADLHELAIAARAGDRRMLEQLLRAVHGAVVRYCRAKLLGRTGGQQTADDVAQEVLLALCEMLPRYNPDASVMAFVLGIARSKIADANRAQGRDWSLPVEAVPDRPDLGDGPELSAVLAAETERLKAALSRLPDNHREVLVLRIAMGYSAEEVARVLGSRPNAVRVTQHRALQKLRVLLGPAADSERSGL